LAALDAGVTMIEGSICGIGGGIAFPDGYGAVGNLPTEDIVSFLESMGVGCDLDVAAAVAAARDIAAMTDTPLLSRASAIMAAESEPTSQLRSPIGSRQV
jgi:hydroxymethylglutaryl-CoA lyase